VEVVLTIDELIGPGFVTDFGDLEPLKTYLDGALDHRDLNEVLDLPPTSENLACHIANWFIANVEPGIPGQMVKVRIGETNGTWAEYTPQVRG
jgi:6-pyruvoyltetrahydropterin/6-carboxytetrahydropterin synthase